MGSNHWITARELIAGIICLFLTSAIVAGEQDNTAASINQFGTDLYGEIVEGSGNNVFFSPFSISTALAMTWAGADGRTADEMADVLHFRGRPEHTHSGFFSLMNSLKAYFSNSDSLNVSVSNALWTDNRYPLNPDYASTVRNQYRANVEQVSYQSDDLETTRQTINNRIAEDTRDRIKELLMTGDIDPSTMLVLTNAIYFKGDWLSQFDPAETRDSYFYTLNGSKEQIDLMHQTIEKKVYKYYAEDDLQLLEFPYVGDDLAMDIILPNKRDGIKDIEPLLDKQLEKWLRNLEYQSKTLELFIPKLDLSCRTDLGNLLMSMGMETPFSSAADFTNMFKHDNAWIDKVIHEANITVDEEGTIAAAATAVIMMKSAHEPEKLVFRADHPFIFLIRDRETGVILFMGRVMNPLG